MGGRGEVRKKYSRKGELNEKSRARQMTLKNIHAPEKNHTRKMITKKIHATRKFPTPITFLMVRVPNVRT